jgi:hypothetical protein
VVVHRSKEPGEGGLSISWSYSFAGRRSLMVVMEDFHNTEFSPTHKVETEDFEIRLSNSEPLLGPESLRYGAALHLTLGKLILGPETWNLHY